MPNNAEVLKPSVKSKKSGHVDNIVIMAQVGAFPRVEMRYHIISSGISKAVPSDIAAKMAESQKGIYGGLQKDSITINDGKNEVTFEGYVVDGTYAIGPGDVGYSQVLVHKSAIVDMFNTGVYIPGKPWRPADDKLDGGNKYTGWMKAALADIVKQWQYSLSSAAITGTTKENAKKIHGENEQPAKAWDAILSASDDTNEFLGKIADTTKGGDASLKEALVSLIGHIYQGAAGGFLQAMDTFGAQFQIKYVPAVFSSSSGSFGKFVTYASMIADGASKQLNLRSMLVRTGISDIIPVTQIAVHGVPSMAYRVQGTTNNGAPTQVPQEIVVFPASSAGGRTYKTMCPSWLPKNVDMGSTVATSTAPLDSKRYLQSAGELRAAKQSAINNISNKAVREWAKSMYVDVAISGARAELAIKLDVSWELGKSYTVQAASDGGGGTDLFTGFLSAITHSISSSAASPKAVTQLTFTHVQAVGFKLPGLT